MTHIDMSQSAKSYVRARRYDPFPPECSRNMPPHAARLLGTITTGGGGGGPGRGSRENL